MPATAIANHVVYVLGTAQDAGLPQFGGRAHRDMAARVDESARRLAPSLCVISPDGRALLVDASPDLKAQEQRLMHLHAYANRTSSSPFDAIVLTHAHIGHYAGLVHFGRECANTHGVDCYATESMQAFLRENGPWSQLVSLENITLRSLDLEADLSIWQGLSIRAYRVPHRNEYTDTVALSFNGRLLYVPDIDDWNQWPECRELVASHEVSMLDATFYSRDELPGRDLSEIPHPFVSETLAFFADLARTATDAGTRRRLVLTHLNHTNPLCDEGSEASREVESAGFEVARELMTFRV